MPGLIAQLRERGRRAGHHQGGASPMSRRALAFLFVPQVGARVDLRNYFVGIFDGIGLARLATQTITGDTVGGELDVGDIVLDGRTIPTWAVRGVGGTSRATLNDQSIYRDNAVRALIDNEAAFGAIADAIDQARQNVRIMQLAFASDCAARQRPGKTTLFTDLLVAAAGRGVSIDILLNKNRFANTVDDLSRRSQEPRILEFALSQCEAKYYTLNQSLSTDHLRFLSARPSQTSITTILASSVVFLPR